MMEWIIFILDIFLAVMFPGQLVNAIRTPDDDKAEDYTMKAGLLLGGIILLTVLLLR